MKNTIHIIGGGIIGLCSAYYLQQEGFDVIVVDKGDLSNSTSTGNAGMIVPSHFVPLAAPGVISQGIKWMFDSKSPFFIRPRLNVDLARWLWKFYRSCNKAHVEKSMHFLLEYNTFSRNLYESFSEDSSFDFCFEKKGLLMLYKSVKQQKEELEHAEKASQLGIQVEIMDQQGISALESNIKIDALGAVYYPEDAHLYPQLFLNQLASKIEEKGGKILRNCELDKIDVSAKEITSFTETNGQKHKVDKILFASGSWTAKLLKKVKTSILLQDGKGYSITMKSPHLKPEIPTILCESKVAVTPMGNDLRIGGTLELSNLSNKVNQSRLDGIIESMPKYYPEFDVKQTENLPVWHGYRPCTPTGIPYLGKIPNFNNSFLATGHGMMGMSLGPATGKLISEIISKKKSSIDVNPMCL